jgi:hypothetical protein
MDECLPAKPTIILVFEYFGIIPSELLLRSGVIPVGVPTFLAWHKATKDKRNRTSDANSSNLRAFLRSLAEIADLSGLRVVASFPELCSRFEWPAAYKAAAKAARSAEKEGRDTASFDAICVYVSNLNVGPSSDLGAKYIFHDACAAGYAKELNRLLSTGVIAPDELKILVSDSMCYAAGSVECLRILRNAGASVSGVHSAAYKGCTDSVRQLLEWGDSAYDAMSGAVSGNHPELVAELEPITRDPILEKRGYWMGLAQPGSVECLRALERAGRFRKFRDRLNLVRFALGEDNAGLVKESFRALRAGHAEAFEARLARALVRDRRQWSKAVRQAIAEGRVSALIAFSQEPAVAEWLRQRASNLIGAVFEERKDICGRWGGYNSIMWKLDRAEQLLDLLARVGARPSWARVWRLAEIGPTLAFRWAFEQAEGEPAERPPDLLAKAFLAGAPPTHLGLVLERAFTLKERTPAALNSIRSLAPALQEEEPYVGWHTLKDPLRDRLIAFAGLQWDVSQLRIALGWDAPAGENAVALGAELALPLLDKGALPVSIDLKGLCARPESKQVTSSAASFPSLDLIYRPTARHVKCAMAEVFRTLRRRLALLDAEQLTVLLAALPSEPIGPGLACAKAQLESAELLREAKIRERSFRPRKRKTRPSEKSARAKTQKLE